MIGWVILVNLLAFLWRKYIFSDPNLSKETALFAQWMHQEFIDETSDNVRRYWDLVYRRWISFLKLGEFQQASWSLMKSFQKTKNPYALNLLKWISLWQDEDFVWADVVLQRATSDNVFEQSAVVLMRWINKYHEWKIKEAHTLVIDSLKLEPVSPLANYYLAKIQADQNQIKASLINFEKAYAWWIERWWEFDLAYAKMLLADDKIVESFEVVKNYAAWLDKVTDEVYVLMWDIAIADGKKQNARKFYELAIGTQSDNKNIYVKYSDMLIDEWELEEAIKLLQQWYDVDHSSIDLLTKKILLMSKNKVWFERLSTEITKTLREFWTDHSQYALLATTLFDVKEYDLVQPILNKLDILSPWDKTSHDLRKKIYTYEAMKELTEHGISWSYAIDIGTRYRNSLEYNMLDMITYMYDDFPEAARRSYQAMYPEKNDLDPLDMQKFLTVYFLAWWDDSKVKDMLDSFYERTWELKALNRDTIEDSFEVETKNIQLEKNMLYLKRIVALYQENEFMQNQIQKELLEFDFRFENNKFLFDQAMKFIIDEKLLIINYIDPFSEIDESYNESLLRSFSLFETENDEI